MTLSILSIYSIGRHLWVLDWFWIDTMAHHPHVTASITRHQTTVVLRRLPSKCRHQCYNYGDGHDCAWFYGPAYIISTTYHDTVRCFSCRNFLGSIVSVTSNKYLQTCRLDAAVFANVVNMTLLLKTILLSIESSALPIRFYTA